MSYAMYADDAEELTLDVYANYTTTTSKGVTRNVKVRIPSVYVWKLRRLGVDIKNPDDLCDVVIYGDDERSVLTYYLGRTDKIKKRFNI